MAELSEAVWFQWRGQVHAEDPVKSARVDNGFVAHCGVSPMEINPDDLQYLNIADIPVGDPCRTCLVAVALESTSDEPIEFALQRGYTSTRHAGDLSET